jgi:hypothetical protein
MKRVHYYDGRKGPKIGSRQKGKDNWEEDGVDRQKDKPSTEGETSPPYGQVRRTMWAQIKLTYPFPLRPSFLALPRI